MKTIAICIFILSGCVGLVCVWSVIAAEESLYIDNGCQLSFEAPNNVSLLEIDEDGNVVGGILHPIYKINDKVEALQKNLESLRMQMTSTFAVVTFEFEYNIEQLKERVEELEKILLDSIK